MLSAVRLAAPITALALILAQAPLTFAAPPDPSTEGPERAAKVAILPLVVEGELPDADRQALAEQLVGGLQRGDFGVVAPDQVVSASGESDCRKPTCIVKVAEKTGATHVVRAIVTVVDRDYTVRVELYDGSDGTTIVTSDDGCEICGVADVGGLIETQAATLRTKLDALASGPAGVRITSNPEGADVLLDGEPYGVTPLDKPIIPGEHTIRLSKDGYISVQEKRTFVEGTTESLDYQLDKVPNRLPKRPWGYASLGVGIAAIGTGVALNLLLVGEYEVGGACTGADIDMDGDCRYLHDTKWPSLALGLVGGALVTLGVAVLLTTSKGKGKAKKEKGGKAKAGLQVAPSGIRF